VKKREKRFFVLYKKWEESDDDGEFQLGQNLVISTLEKRKGKKKKEAKGFFTL